MRPDDPLAGPVSGMIEERCVESRTSIGGALIPVCRIRTLEDSVFPLDSLDAASITF